MADLHVVPVGGRRRSSTTVVSCPGMTPDDAILPHAVRQGAWCGLVFMGATDASGEDARKTTPAGSGPASRWEPSARSTTEEKR